jgi:hypothetical protein
MKSWQAWQDNWICSDINFESQDGTGSLSSDLVILSANLKEWRAAAHSERFTFSF